MTIDAAQNLCVCVFFSYLFLPNNNKLCHIETIASVQKQFSLIYRVGSIPFKIINYIFEALLTCFDKTLKFWSFLSFVSILSVRTMMRIIYTSLVELIIESIPNNTLISHTNATYTNWFWITQTDKQTTFDEVISLKLWGFCTRSTTWNRYLNILDICVDKGLYSAFVKHIWAFQALLRYIS